MCSLKLASGTSWPGAQVSLSQPRLPTSLPPTRLEPWKCRDLSSAPGARERSNVSEAHRQSGGPRRSPAGKASLTQPQAHRQPPDDPGGVEPAAPPSWKLGWGGGHVCHLADPAGNDRAGQPEVTLPVCRPPQADCSRAVSDYSGRAREARPSSARGPPGPAPLTENQGEQQEQTRGTEPQKCPP